MSNVDEDLFPDDNISSENSSTSSIEVPYFLQTPKRINTKLRELSDNIGNVTNFNIDNLQSNRIIPLKSDSNSNIELNKKDCKDCSSERELMNAVKIENLCVLDESELPEFANGNIVEDWLASARYSPEKIESDKKSVGNIISKEDLENFFYQTFSSGDEDEEEESGENDEELDLFEPPSKENYDDVLKFLQLTNQNSELKFDFIHSLLDCVENKYRDPEAHRFRINYKYWKFELARRIFNIFNEKVFLNKLPNDTKIIFNSRLLKTGGRCLLRYEKDRSKYITIDISPKVCTDANRLLNVMIHEMCHGATFMISNVREVHGPVWKTWCICAKKAFPLVSMSTRCHSYAIKTKYQYRCESCLYKKSRHSKFKGKPICEICGRNLVLFSDGGYGVHLQVDENKPLTGFAAFVKKHYKDARCDSKDHKETMKILSEKFYLEKLQCETDLRKSLLKDDKL